VGAHRPVRPASRLLTVRQDRRHGGRSARRSADLTSSALHQAVGQGQDPETATVMPSAMVVAATETVPLLPVTVPAAATTS